MPPSIPFRGRRRPRDFFKVTCFVALDCRKATNWSDNLIRRTTLDPAEIEKWALSHGFRQTGANAYSAMHEGYEYQMLLRKDIFQLQRKRSGRVLDGFARSEYRNLHIDEHGMLANAGLCDAFVRSIWRGGEPPVWFTSEFTAHARETIIPGWEAALATMRSPGVGFR
jgi:hypothetical protein